MLKKFLEEKKVEFEEIDLSAEPDKVSEMVEVSGQLGVPVTVIDGQAIVGYDRVKLEAAITGR